MRISMFRIATLLAALCGFVLSAPAAWYWPFDTDPDSTNKPPRLHRLLEKANQYIERAEDEALNGDADKSIEYYRDALKELDRVELENPERVDLPEFAPLRSKRATCTAAIDSIRFAQVNENERAVSVSNTRDLERKWRKKHGRQTPEDIAHERRAAARTNVVEAARTNAVEKVEPPAQTNRVEATGLARLDQDDRRKNKLPVPPSDGSVEAEIKVALAHIRNEDYALADAKMERLLEKHPKNLNVLLIRAAAQAGSGSKFAARRTLERAMRTHPKSYLPYYNLANLTLQMGEDRAIAREYYDMGRAVGGPRNEALERKLK